jgi:hypothetical protein
MAVLAGCSSRPPALPQPVKAKGKIVGENELPLKFVRVVLHPKEQGGVECYGDVGEDGTFVLTTYKKDDGAVPGKYTVVVEPLDYKNATGPVTSDDADRVPKKYQSEEKSGVEVEIKSGGPDLDLHLKG